MNDHMQVFDRLPAHVTDVVRHAHAGDPESVADSDLHKAYSHVAVRLSRDDFEHAAAEAFGRLTPGERSRIADRMRSEAEQRDIPVAGLPSGTRAAADPGAMASAAADMNEREPSLLQDLCAPGGTFSSPLAKTALLGITSFAAERLARRF